MTATARQDRPGPPAGLVTEFDFVLPHGYLDERGHTHRAGTIRLATARDEIDPQADRRVRANPAYLTVLLLSRTLTRLGRYAPVPPEVVEGLFAADLAFLQDLYRRVNGTGDSAIPAHCPGCGADFTVQAAGEQVGEW